jgi:hypothetical protein
MPPISAPPQRETGSIGFNLGAIFMLVALAALALAYAIDAAGRSAGVSAHRLDNEMTLTRTIGGKDLEIPLSWFRYAEQRVEGFAKQIDLQLEMPLGAANALTNIEVTLLPRSRARPSSGLLDGVYLHQFGPGEVDGPIGLIGKPLKAAEGFEDETVWYDPISSDPFVAKCVSAVASGTDARCLRTVHLGPGIAAVYAFDAGVLENWKQFDPEVRAMLGRIGI